MEVLQYISVFIEVAIAIFGFLIATRKKKSYGYGILLTFVIYAFYDLSRLADLKISNNFLYSLFFIATLSALWFVYSLYTEKSRKNKK